MKRMVDNAQTLNQVAKYTDVVENDTNATLQWEGNIEVNGNIHTKSKEIVEIAIQTGGLELTPDTSKRYHFTRDPNNNTDEQTSLTLNLDNYIFSWDYAMNFMELHGVNEWIGGLTEGWDEPEGYIEITAAKDYGYSVYVWFDEVNKVAHIHAQGDI